MAIGTTAALIGASAVGAVATASSANRAAKAQTQAAQAATDASVQAAERDIAFQRETRDLTFSRLDPFYQGGQRANQALMSEMGLGPAPEGFAGFEASPGYQFRLQQGQDAVNALAGARGGLVSGRTLEDLSTFNQGIASQEYGNFYNRLAGLADTGFSAASGMGNAAQNTAAGVSNALAGIGNAQAAGAAGIGNARAAGAVGVGNAISGGINNAIGIWGYQQGLSAPINRIGMPMGGR